MSQARLVITAVVLEGCPAAQVIAEYGISTSWLYELLARYRTVGGAAFEAHSRWPHKSPTSIDPAVATSIVRLRRQLTDDGLDAGPATIRGGTCNTTTRSRYRSPPLPGP